MFRTCCFLICLFIGLQVLGQPLALNPKNPFYFQYKGKTSPLIGSGEHYGAVMNLDFDYRKYLLQQQKDGLNLTRLFTGPYREGGTAFGIQKNTMNPAPQRYLCAWKRVDSSRYDLTQWNEAYFARLKDFVRLADSCGVVVEITLFTSFYGDSWKLSPFHPKNNINEIPEIPYQKVQTLENGKYILHQERYVQKIIEELNEFDNLYFEIQNEPWADNGVGAGVWNDYIQPDMLKETGNYWRCRLEPASRESLEWQSYIAQIIRKGEEKFKKRHLISQNMGNFNVPVPDADFNVDMLTFHYALPQVLAQNRYHQKLIGFNETGFSGSGDDAYRRQAWRFLMSGGGLFNHLDYSFSVGQETGQDANYVAPGGGSQALRQQLGVLKFFLNGFKLDLFRPDSRIVQSAGAFHYALSDQENQWAIYFEGYQPFSVHLRLEKGDYQTTWINAKTGEILYTESFEHKEGLKTLDFRKEAFQESALKIIRKN